MAQTEPTAHQRLTRAGLSAQFADLVLGQRDREVVEQAEAAASRAATEATNRPAHDGGPTVQEATADDRRWPLEKAGE